MLVVRQIKRNIYMILFLMAGTASALATTSLVLPSSPPSLVADKAEHDFGRVPQGARVEARFELSNNTDKIIHILKFIKSCDCTEVTATKTALRPGERLMLTARWDTKGRRGESRSKINTIYYYNGDMEKAFQLATSVSADVVPDVVYTPEQLTFSSAPDPSRGRQVRTVVFSSKGKTRRSRQASLLRSPGLRGRARRRRLRSIVRRVPG